jgi:hypothetical protein
MSDGLEVRDQVDVLSCHEPASDGEERLP